MNTNENNESFIFSLIIEDLEESISAENILILNQWREADAENEKTYQEFHNLQTNLDKLAEGHVPDVQQSWNTLDQKLKQQEAPVTMGIVKGNSRHYFWMKVAAVFLALSTLGYGYFFWKNKEVLINTGMAAVSNVVLPDGTTLKLNAGTTISYSKNNFLSDRKLVLVKGEAFIQVAANSASRFRVDLGAVEAKDIGTRFNISRNVVKTTVIVEEGEVELTEAGTSRKVNLTAGKMGIYDVADKTLNALDNPDPNYKAWLDKRFVFTEVPLQQVLQQLEKVYQAKIEIEGESLKTRKLTAKLQYQDLDTALAVVSASLDLKLAKADGKYVLSLK
ncbi:FecR family protein [Pedobacter gandavensis]|uniref:FecR family protein n=1 Tax=Pedobacter gandavensis TaxID=2679963 RepID=UPI00292F5DEC|nr:FecR domain-containing protein [Pedobacter gandavensis]